jgi:hypothetical protein
MNPLSLLSVLVDVGVVAMGVVASPPICAELPGRGSLRTGASCVGSSFVPITWVVTGLSFYSVSTSFLSPTSIICQFSSECWRASTDLLLSWVRVTVVPPLSSLSSILMS